MTDELQEAEGKKRRPFRFLFKLAFYAGLIYLVSRFIADRKDEYTGLTESQARDKFMTKMAPRIGDDNASEIANRVIPKLKERGLLKPDVAESVRD